MNLALKSWHKIAIEKSSKANVTFPLSPERLDIAVYNCLYHTYGQWLCRRARCILGNKDIQNTLMRYCFDQHDWNNRKLRLKKFQV